LLPTDEDRDGGGTEGYGSMTGAGNGAGGFELSDAEEGVVTSVTLDTYEAGLKPTDVPGENGNGDADDEGEFVSGVGTEESPPCV